jgi:hypothetical protein
MQEITSRGIGQQGAFAFTVDVEVGIGARTGPAPRTPGMARAIVGQAAVDRGALGRGVRIQDEDILCCHSSGGKSVMTKRYSITCAMASGSALKLSPDICFARLVLQAGTTMADSHGFPPGS